MFDVHFSFHCLNQDGQDYRIYRIRVRDIHATFTVPKFLRLLSNIVVQFYKITISVNLVRNLKASNTPFALLGLAISRNNVYYTPFTSPRL